MGTKEIFISYKSEEFEDALWVKETLENNGFSCWMAPMCISGGANYATEIPKAIKDCKILVLILSEKVQESKWVPRELDQAINSDKLIMPFMLEDCALKSEFEFYLSNVQYYSAYLDKEATMERMLKDIRRYLGYPEPQIAPAPIVSAETVTQPNAEVTPSQVDHIPSPKKRKPPIIAKNRSTPVDKNKKAKPKIVIPAILGMVAVLAITIGAILLPQLQKITIAGTVFDKDDYSVHIDGKNIDSDDIAALAKFEDLTFLEFTNCAFGTDDLNAISNHDLRTLTIENCDLTDAQLQSLDFKALEKLTQLNLNGNQKLTNLEVLSPLADSLNALYINGTSPSSLEVIGAFTRIEVLSVNQVGISDLSMLNNMAYLEELYADGNNIETLRGLENTTILSRVSLNNNRISDVSVFAKSAETLKHLYLDNNAISDLSALADCKNLRVFSAKSNQLTSAAFLSKWKSLQSLSLANNSIESIAGYVWSENLTNIDFSNNKLTAIKGITLKKDGYIDANFSNNAISTVYLPEDCHFSTLALHGNPLDNAYFLVGIQGSKISFDFFDELAPENLKTAAFFHIYIADCPTDRKVALEKASYSVTLTTADEIDGLIFE